MQRLSVIRNGVLFNLDTADDTPAIRQTLFNPEDITKAGSGYTYTFTLPATPVNQQFFEFYDQPQTYNPQVSNLGIATYFWDESPIFNGVLTLRGYSKEGYDVGIRQLNQGWIDLAQINCRDVSIASELVCINRDGGFFENNIDGWVVPLVDFGKLQEDPLQVESGYLRLWMRFYDVFRSVLPGYTVQSTFMEEFDPVIYSGDAVVLRSNNYKVKWNSAEFTKIANVNIESGDITTVTNVPNNETRYYFTMQLNENRVGLTDKVITEGQIGFYFSTAITCFDDDWVELEISWDLDVIITNNDPLFPLSLGIKWGDAEYPPTPPPNTNQFEIVGVNVIPASATLLPFKSTGSTKIRAVSKDLYFSMFFLLNDATPAGAEPIIEGQCGWNIRATENIYNLKMVPKDNFPDETVSKILSDITTYANLNVTTNENNIIEIEPITLDITDPNNIDDWTNKVDVVDYEIEPNEAFSSKFIKFTWEESNGDLSKRWKTGVALPNQPQFISPSNLFTGNFGDLTVTTNSFVQGEQTVDASYASYIQVNYPLVSLSPYVGKNTWRSAPFENNYGETYIGTYYEAAEDQNDPPNGVGVSYRTPLPNKVGTLIAGVWVYTQPPPTIFSISPIPSVQFSTDGFVVAQNVAAPPTTTSWRFDGENGLYNRFWKDFINKTINQRVFVYKVYLTVDDITNLDLRKTIRIDNRYYKLIELDNWSPDSQVATCRLIQLL